MSKIKLLIVWSTISLLLMSISIRTQAEAAQVKPIDNHASDIADVLLTHYGATGVQYAIRDQGKVVLSGGIGLNNRGERINISNNTMFGIGSVSKMYVTAATMLLADKGKLDIDEPLYKYIQEFEMDDERYKKITPRMLMNHSAGLYGTHYKNSMLFDDNDTENHDMLLKNLKHERLKSEPGEYSVYANDGFQLLEILVERISGLTYSEFIAEQFSTPLKLTHTKTPLDVFDRNQLYPVYLPFISEKLPTENANVIGSGGLYATAEQLTSFAEVLIGKYPSILSEQSAKAMQQHEYKRGVWVEDESNTYSYGLGWDAVELFPFDKYGITALTKGGDTILYHSALITLPEHNISIALLTAGGSSIFNTTAATNLLFSYLQEKGIIEKLNEDKSYTAPTKQPLQQSVHRFAGLYGNVGSTINIEIKDDKLHLPALMDGFIPEQSYIYIGNNEFSSEDGATVFSFEEAENGHIYTRVKAYIEFPGLGETLLAYFESQKLKANEIDHASLDAWLNRHGKSYYVLDEKINSLFFIAPQLVTKVLNVEAGYVNGTKIIDETHTTNISEIPVMNGRDAFDLSIQQNNGVEYLKADGKVFISEEAVLPLYKGSKSKATIGEEGYARWFKIDEYIAGKTMQVDFSSTGLGGFAVYDENGMLIHLYSASKQNTVALPNGGLIVFGGQIGEVFNISLQ